MQEHECTSHILFLFYLHGDLLCFAQTDPFYLCQPFRLFFDNAQTVIPKPFYDPAGKRFTNALDRTASQIAADTFRIRRFNDLVLLHLKLLAVIGIVFRLSGDPQHCPLHISLKNAGNDQLFFFIICGQHTIPVALVVVDHMVYKYL